MARKNIERAGGHRRLLDDAGQCPRRDLVGGEGRVTAEDDVSLGRPHHEAEVPWRMAGQGDDRDPTVGSERTRRGERAEHGPLVADQRWPSTCRPAGATRSHVSRPVARADVDRGGRRQIGDRVGVVRVPVREDDPADAFGGNAEIGEPPIDALLGDEAEVEKMLVKEAVAPVSIGPFGQRFLREPSVEQERALGVLDHVDHHRHGLRPS